VCKGRRVLANRPLAWVFESEAEALFAAAEHHKDTWFLLSGAHHDGEAALKALGAGQLLLSHSARAPTPVPRTGPFLVKCPVR
jgi:hypothetical protein